MARLIILLISLALIAGTAGCAPTQHQLTISSTAGGSVITPGDADKLKAMGVAAAFGPSSTKEQIVETINQIVPVRD